MVKAIGSLRGAVVFESLSWRKPGVLEVVASRLSPASSTGLYPETQEIPISEVVKYIDAKLIGRLDETRVERVGDGVFKISNVYKKILSIGGRGKDLRTYALRSGIERIGLHLAPFIDQIMERYSGWQHPVTRDVYFPRTIPKKNLERKPNKNPHNKPWTGHDWPVLVEPPGHINNPYHGVRFFISPFSEFTIEEGRSGNFTFEEVERRLGLASPPPADTGFAFSATRARSVNVIMSDGENAKIKPQERWVVVGKNIRKQGEGVSISTTWRSRAGAGWPKPVYNRGWSG